MTAITTPATAHRTTSARSRAPASSAALVAHRAIPAAISVPLGLIPPPRCTATGVTDTATATSPHRRAPARSSAATAIATSAPNTAAATSRMPSSPAAGPTTRLGQPTSTYQAGS